MRKRTKLLISKKKKVFLFIGILSFLCLISAIAFLLFYDYYPVESRVNNVEKYASNDTDDYTTVGWLRVQGTNIDYPVIYTPDYDLSKKTDDFVWTDVSSDRLLNKVNIIGHNILNLSTQPLVASENHRRFEQLMSFIYLDFVRDNKYIQYTFQGEEYVYKIFSVSFVSHDETGLYAFEDYTDEEMNDYIQKSLEDSIFEFDIDVNENDKIISLITCTRMYGPGNDIEFKVDARLVRNGELKTNYGVQKSDKYQEIDDIMKGGENNA